MADHVHEVGRRRQGPQVESYLRCVCCGSSTRNRKYQSCTLSDAEGGRICTKCIKSHPHRALECSLWVPHERESYCHNCTAPRGDLLNCFCCDNDVCVSCVDPLTMAFFWATGSMYMLCDSCSPSELYICPETNEKTADNDIAQYVCGLCQDWHVGKESDDPKAQIEECDLPWDEAPPICKTAFSLSRGGDRLSQSTAPPKSSTGILPRKSHQKNGTSSASTTEPTSQAGPLMILRDTVLSLVGKIDKLDSRMAKIEKVKKAPEPSIQPLDNAKETQTETDGALYPPACPEALELWKKYKISQKTETEILVEALKALDLKQIIENQNRQISQQTNLLNNMHRNFAQFSKNKNESGPPTAKNETNPTKKSRNGPSKRRKDE